MCALQNPPRKSLSSPDMEVYASLPMVRPVTKDPAESDFDAISWIGLIVVGLPLA